MDKIADHEKFLEAIQEKKKILVTFFSQEDRREISRLCAPLDFGPSRRNGTVIDNGKNKYHFWDYESDTKQHTLPLISTKIRVIEVRNETFNPRIDFDFNIDNVNWFVPRNW
jgi:hypothetical protein